MCFTILLTPLSNHVLLEPVHPVSKGGIIIIENADQEPTNKGKVLAVGSDVKLPIKKGDEVLFKPHLFEALDAGGNKFHLIGREDGIYAKC